MIQSNDRLSAVQVSVIIMSCILGVEMLALPGKLARTMETPDGWISIILGSLTTVIAGVLIITAGRLFPGKTVFEYGSLLLGNWLGKGLAFLFWLYFVLVSAFEVRALTEVIKLFLLEDTPRSVLIIIVMPVAVYLIHGGINAIARLYELLLPITLFLLFFMLCLSWKVFDIENLRPVMGSGIKPVLKAVPDTALAYLGIEVMYILPAIMNRSENAGKAIYWAIGISLVCFEAIFIATIGGISVDNTASLTWPTISLFRSFEYTGVIFERFETIMIILWVLRVFSVYTMFHYLTSLSFTHLTKKKFDSSIFVQLPVIYIIAVTPSNLNDLFHLGKYLGYGFYFFGGLLPLSLLLIAKLKGVGVHARKAG